MDSLSTRARRFLGTIGAVASFSLIAAGLSPAAVAQPVEDTVPVADGKSSNRPDGVSAQVTAKATGHRVEDLSQRTDMEQVFANPDGTWTSEASNVVRFAEKDGDMVPIEDLGTLESAGTAVTGAGTELSIADGTDNLGDGPTKDSVPLATLAGTGEDKGTKLELGWEGDLPKPVVQENTATYTDGVQVPVTDAPATNQDTADATVTVEPTTTGFSHQTILDTAPEGDVELRFPIKLSQGLKAVQDKETGDLRAVDADGKTVFFAPAPTMWDAKIDKRSGLHAAETPVETSLETEGRTAVLVLKASRDWLQAPEREYPVTIDPSWTSGVSDTWVQADVPGSKAGDQEIRVGTFNGGTLRSRSFLQFGSTALAGKKITKAELRLNNYYSYSCSSAPIKVQRLTTEWTASTARWTAQPKATISGEGTLNTSKGYSDACKAAYVYYPVTPIAQYWADNPTKNFGVRLIAADETNNLSWKRYRSANYAASTTAHPLFVVTYNSYPYTPTAVSFGSGQSVKDASGKLWVKTLKPQLRATVSDPDGGNVKAEFDMSGTSTLSKAAGTSVAAKSVSTYNATLANGGTYTARAWANDGSLRSKAAGAGTTFTVDTTAPTAPAIASSGGYANNGWKDTRPSANTFTFTSSADTHQFQYQTNNDAWKTLTAASGKATLNWNPTGANILRVKAIDKATNTSTTTTWTFGNGAASLTAPASGVTTSDAFKVTAAGPTSATGTVTPTVYWREAGTVEADTAQYGATTGWYKAADLGTIAQGQPVKVDHLLDIATAPANKLKDLGKDRVPALVEVQVCFDYAGAPAASKLQCTTNKTKKPVRVTKLPHAFGDNYPVADAGDGQVALATGELNLSATDVEVDAGNTGLSVSRSYSSYSGIGANSRIFGKGWRANIDGPDEGLSGLLVAESTALDGTITLINDDESAAVFRQPGNGRTPLKAGTYTAANEDATASGWKLALTGTGTTTRITVTEEDGTVTTFKKGANLEGNPKIFEWVPDTVAGGNSVGTSRFVSNAAGLTTKVISGTETALNCDPVPVRGCRILNLDHDASGKATKVTYTAWDPAKNDMNTVPIAEYGYDGTTVDAKLTTVKDSRTGDITTYTYTVDSAAGVPLVASTEEKTSTGKRVDAPIYYEYGRGDTTTGRSDWLEAVKRGSATDGSGKTQFARFVYGINPMGNGSDLPDLSTKKTGLWDQEQEPETGFAVFGPGKDISTSKAAGVAAADWKFADLQYVDADNRVVNTSSYAAGDWQSTAQVFNEDGNITRSYEARGIRNILKQAEDDPDTVSTETGMFLDHMDYASLSYYFDDLAAFVDEEGNGLSSKTDRVEKAAEIAQNEATAGFLRGYVTDTYSPVTTDENDQPSRVHTSTTYTGTDDLDAGGMPRMLVTRESTTKANSGAINLTASEGTPISETENGYNAFEVDGAGTATTSKANKRSGWVVRAPTKVTTVMGGSAANDITVETRFDDQGRVKEARQPQSAGSDAGAVRSIYYTSGPNPEDTACGNKPEYAGYLCKSTPQGAGSVKKHQSGFNIYGQPTLFTESSTGTDGATRTTVQTYRNDGQELKTTVTTTGVTGSTAVPAVEKVYDDRGIQTGTRTGAGTAGEVTWAKDLWGRITSYKNSLGETTTTEYDAFGNVAKTVTSRGITTYKYGALSGDLASGEYQGVVTSMTISNHGAAGQNGTYTATYDGDGNLLTQGIPGDFKQINSYDEGTGKPTGLSYTGPVKDADGKTTTATWISWSTVRDVTGRIVGENTPDGDLLHGTGTSGDRAAEYDKTYQYDRAGRLTQVTDLTAQPGETINTDPAEGDTTPTTVRKYTFDKNGNRTSLTTSVNGTQTAQKAWAYDAADRVGVGAGYVYDGLGRQTTIPAKDAPQTSTTAAGTGDIKIGYYDDDSARTITRGGITTTIGLDPAGRRLSLATTGSVGTETKHYTDDSDNPAWTTRTQGTNTVTTRYESTIGGDLALTITDGTVELAVNNPHGDTVTTIPLTGDEAGQGIKGWAQYDEYGNQTPDPVSTGATTYGWHGADQRALDASGLILMGARLYNSTTGVFTSRDPVAGGNSTTYAHPQDPIGMSDISGEWGFAKRLWAGTKRAWRSGAIARGVGYAALGACVVLSAGACGAVALGAAAVSGAYRFHHAYRQVKYRKANSRTAYTRAALGTLADIGLSRLPGLRTAKWFIKGKHALRPKAKVRYKSRWKPRGRYGWRTSARIGGLVGGGIWVNRS
ncbi:DNRLRE domain-containing protein [Arthrobacter sp.]|uniref:DNRLRE domain-containing protein n=1 Tax=Arthrobacter sp. TaxID=1667 RepID=UPI003A93B155